MLWKREQENASIQRTPPTVAGFEAARSQCPAKECGLSLNLEKGPLLTTNKDEIPQPCNYMKLNSANDLSELEAAHPQLP